MQTQIRLLLEEQSDQGLHCLLFYFHHFDKIPFRFGLFIDYRIFFGNFMVSSKMLPNDADRIRADQTAPVSAVGSGTGVYSLPRCIFQKLG